MISTRRRRTTWSRLIHRLLAQNPADQPPSAVSVAEAIRRWSHRPPGPCACRGHPPCSSSRPARAADQGSAAAAQLLDDGHGRARHGPGGQFRLALLAARAGRRDRLRHGAPFDGPNKELGEHLKTGIDTYCRASTSRAAFTATGSDCSPWMTVTSSPRTLANVRELREQKHVFGLLGNVGTAPVSACLPYAIENKMLFFGSLSGGKVLRKDPPDRYVFNYRASFAEETARIVNCLCKVAHQAGGDRRHRPERRDRRRQLRGRGPRCAQLRRGQGKDPASPLRPRTSGVPDRRPRRSSRKDIKAVVMIATYVPAAEVIVRAAPQA